MASKHIWKTKITDNTADQREQLEIVRREWNATDSCYKDYKYVKASLTATASNGVVVGIQDHTCSLVTSSRPCSKPNKVAGVCVGALNNGYYGWIQIGGYHSAIDTDGIDTIARGDWLLWGSGNATRGAAGAASSVKIIGVATHDDDDTANTVAGMIDCTYGDTLPGKSIWNTHCSINASTAKEQVGAIRREYDDKDHCFKTFKFVQASLATSTAIGNGTTLACYNVGCTVVTNDISTANKNQPAGVAIGTVTHNYYAWIQVGGFHPAINMNADDDAADGDTIILDTTTDGTANTVASGTAPTNKPLAIATDAVVTATNKCAGMVCCVYGDIMQ